MKQYIAKGQQSKQQKKENKLIEDANIFIVDFAI
jgi:hypothetical protein